MLDREDVTKENVVLEKGITIKEMEAILNEVYDVRHHLPEKPVDGEPIVMTEIEERLFKERGQFTRHWRDGSASIIMSQKRHQELEKMLK